MVLNTSSIYFDVTCQCSILRKLENCYSTTGVDLSEILGVQTKDIGGNGGNNWWKHRRFSIIGEYVSGCPPYANVFNYLIRVWLQT